MKIKSKIFVKEVTDNGVSDVVKFEGISAGSQQLDAEQNTFTITKPKFKLKMEVDSPNLKGFLKPGVEYFLEFTKV